ncbi:MAG: hypothetical protein ABIP55_01170 [Tepidisphaeraceae bacterium]
MTASDERRQSDSTPRADVAGGAAFVAALAIIAIIAAFMVGYATRDGMGLSLDSDAYLTAARQLLRGEGFTLEGIPDPQPLTHFPPLYSLLLAGGAKLLAADVLVAARVLNVALFGGTVLMVGLILRRGIGLPRAAALVGAAVVAVSVHLLFIHAMVWSEGLFIFLILLTLGLLGAFLDGHRRSVLIGAVIAASLALLTRYAGAGLVLAGSVTLLLCGVRTRRQRFADATIFGAISCLPMAAWVLRNIQYTGSAANRQLAFHPPDAELMEMAVETIAHWFWPSPRNWLMWTGFGAAVTLLAIAALSARNARAEGRRSRSDGGEAGGAAGALAWFSFSYVLFILTSITLFDAHSPLDGRILAPLFAAAAIGVIAEFARSSLPPGAGALSRVWPKMLAAIACVFIAGQSIRIGLWVQQAPELHLGYGTRMWRDSDLVTFVRTIPADVPVYSNGRAAIHLHTGRVVRPLPGKVNLATRQPHTNFAQRLRALERDLKNRGGYVVFFTDIRHRTVVQDEELREAMSLEAVYSGRDGDVYRWKARSEKRGDKAR